MKKILYIIPFLSLSISAAFAGYEAVEEYERSGKVFKDKICRFVKEKNEHGQVRHRPVEPNNPAAVEYTSRNATLFYKYFEVRSSDYAVMSFNVSPKPHNEREFYASIPVKIDETQEEMEILIFRNHRSTPESEDEYASTIVGALEIL